MKRKLNVTTFVVLAGLGSSVAGCVGGSNGSTTNTSNTTTATSQTAQNSRQMYSIPIKSTESGTNGISFQKVRLKQLSTDSINAAYKLSSAKSMSLQSVASNIPSYNVVSTGADSDLNNFYGANQQTVLNQQAFGSCVTFSSTAALGYLLYNDTGAISPLKFLLQGFVTNNSQAGDGSGNYTGNFASGWDGLNGADNILHRVLNISGDLYNEPGVVQESWGIVPPLNYGYYKSSQADTDTYNKFSQEYVNSGSPNVTTSVLRGLSGFNEAVNQYIQESNNGAAIKENGNAIANSDIIFTPGSTSNDSATVQMKQALDKGHKLLIGFTVYDSNVPVSASCANSSAATPTGDAYYTFDSSSGILSLNTDQSNTSTDTWSNPSGCLLGGHEVFVVGYLQDASGNIIFVIRNSWGNGSGDQGNFYMTQDYANVAVMSINEVYKI